VFSCCWVWRRESENTLLSVDSWIRGGPFFIPRPAGLAWGIVPRKLWTVPWDERKPDRFGAGIPRGQGHEQKSGPGESRAAGMFRGLQGCRFIFFFAISQKAPAENTPVPLPSSGLGRRWDSRITVICWDNVRFQAAHRSAHERCLGPGGYHSNIPGDPQWPWGRVKGKSTRRVGRKTKKPGGGNGFPGEHTGGGRKVGNSARITWEFGYPRAAGGRAVSSGGTPL